ncbi:hypothetical protein CLU96_1716 [Chryseobacterium sp. 52]|uniref:hypothetical protein n=1 Tax=Chryseobacterium sp. 52 TaxID=2035213 RepID=UPI000C3DE041|nr:hypothetical protein [Chryseobacterium sp. 52]PIF44722.1 hypothetical protein CLU96_1716 [Chryseobacterium sp. 52]
MSQRKFILLSILKTFLISAIVSTVILIIYIMITEVPREHPNEPPRNCDMSGLAYVLLIFWILSMSIVSFSSLLSLLKPFQGKIERWLCWFLLPILTTGYFFVEISGGKIDGDGIAFFLIANLPWFLLWGVYYSNLKKH